MVTQNETNEKDKSKEPTFSQEFIDFLSELRQRVKTDISDRAKWKQKMIIAVNQRLGVKRYSNFPYPGAPDIPLPETDKLIKKSVPNLVLSAWSPKIMCKVRVKQGVEETEELKAKAKKSERAMNMYLRSPEMDFYRKLMLAADNRKQCGHCIFKITEKYQCTIVSKTIDTKEMPQADIDAIKSLSKSDKRLYFADMYSLDVEDKDDLKVLDDIISQLSSGEEIIEFQIPVYTCIPMISIVDPVKITVPSYTQDINNASRIREEFFLPRHILEQLMEDEIFLKRDLDEIPSYSGGDDDYLTTTKSRNEGLSDNTSKLDLYHMESISCWYRSKETEPFSRKIFTFFVGVSDPETALVQDIDFPYEFDGWFYEKDDNETKDSRYLSSRGVPEQIRAMQEIMERSLNNKIIRDEMGNTPMWEVLSTSQIMDAHVRMIPGGKLPVQALGTEIKQLNDYPRSDPNSTEIMQILKAYTEEYLSVSDQLFRNATNTGGGKTLGEIQVGIQQNSGSLNLEVISWNESLSRVYTKMFKILKERLGDSIYIDGEEITKDDFDFPAEVRSNGDLEVANEQLATQKAFARLQVLLNPALQDIVNSEDRYNAVKDWLEKDGVKDPDQFCTDPKIIAQEQIAQMQQQLQGMQQQMVGMQEEAKGAIKQKQQAKRQKDSADAEAQEAQDTSDQLNQGSMEKMGEEMGNELLAGATSGTGQR
jgi:hypothetical protein